MRADRGGRTAIRWLAAVRHLAPHTTMFLHHLRASVRSFRRSLVYGVVDIAGLAVGFLAALLIALFIAHEYSYDRFLPDSADVYRISAVFKRANAALDTSQKQLAAYLKLDYPQVRNAARLLNETHSLRRGSIEFNETVYWADPAIFDVLRLPTLHARGGGLLTEPTAIVITQSVARKYFGRVDVVGQFLELDRKHMFQVSAVLRDLPGHTHLNTEILLPAHAAASGLKSLDASKPGDVSAPVYTYLRLAPGADAAQLRRDLPALLDRHWSPASGRRLSATVELRLTQVHDIHMHGTGLFSMRPGGDPGVALALGLVAMLVVAAACINFINLTTARSSHRMIEVGIRKCFGASRRHLVLQFIGESSAIVALAFVLALAAAHLCLPAFSAFLQRDIRIEWWSQPQVLVAMLAFVAVVGTCAGLYPAFVLSSFRPADVLRSGRAANAGSNLLRLGLIVSQFSILIGLLVATLTIQAQMRYAMDRNTRAAQDSVLAIETDCKDALAAAIRLVPGVRATACSQSAPTNRDKIGTSAALPTGEAVQVDISPVDFGFFELYDMKPLAGRFFSRQHPKDAAIPGAPFQAPLVLNETAMHRMGFATPQQTIGKLVTLQHDKSAQTSEVIGVVADFVVDSLRQPVAATAYFVDPQSFQLLHVRLDPARRKDITLRIDRLWNEVTNTDHPISRFYIDDYFRGIYETMRQETAMFTALSAVAGIIAAIGLVGLAAYTAERRFKEIGIRKALGAEPADIVSMLLWQFTKPIVWANAVAWPVTAYFISIWLRGFAYHIALPWHLFPACGAAALAGALAIVSTQSYLAACARPVTALQYE